MSPDKMRIAFKQGYLSGIQGGNPADTASEHFLAGFALGMKHRPAYLEAADDYVNGIIASLSTTTSKYPVTTTTSTTTISIAEEQALTGHTSTTTTMPRDQCNEQSHPSESVLPDPIRRGTAP